MQPPNGGISTSQTRFGFTNAMILLALSLTLAGSPSRSQVGLRAATPSSPSLEAIAFLEQGLALRAQGKAPAAHAAIEQALRLAPSYAEAYTAKAALLFEQGRSIEAIASYEQALNLNPNLVAAYLGKGQALARQGKRNAAREFLKSAQKSFRDQGDSAQADVIAHLLPGL